MTKILVVDDLKAELKLIKSYLEKYGYHVVTASDAQDALVKASQFHPDVIITDLVMPEMSGLEFCRKLKKDPENKNVPIIAWTTKSRDIDKRWAKKQGIDAYLVKPCTDKEIVKTVKSVLV